MKGGRAQSALVLGLLLATGCGGGIEVFPGLAGPAGATVVPPARPLVPGDLDAGTASRLALLVTGTDSSWIGLAHGLRSIGIPTRVTSSQRAALEHRVVILYPADAALLPGGFAVGDFEEFVTGGGTLIGIAARGDALKGVFGYGEATESRDRMELRFLPGGQFSDPRELTLRLGKPPRDEARRALSTLLYSGHNGRTIATYEDGGAAMFMRRAGAGAAIAIGVDAARIVALGQNNRDEYMARSDVSEYEPSGDVFLRFLKALYAAGEPAAVTLGTVPGGRDLAVLLTHDIVDQESIANAVAFARLENEAGVRGTYFIQTKYVRDFHDGAFFKEENLAHLREIRDLGMEIGSHSVSRSGQFDQFPPGTGREAYPDYRPRVIDHRTTEGGTVLGELRVSKFLLESLLGVEVVSFRPGHYSYPLVLPEALAAAGYSFSSSSTANGSLTHLPFQLTHSRGFTAQVPIFEFPVTLEDERIPAVRRLEPALELAGKLRTYGGLYNVLIHTSRLDEEIAFERAFIEATRATAWFSTMGDFGRFWRARNRVALDVRRERGAGMIVRLEAPEPIEGLALTIPQEWTIARAPAGTGSPAPGRIVLPRIEGIVELAFRAGR